MFRIVFIVNLTFVLLKAAVAVASMIVAVRLARSVPSKAWNRKRAGAMFIAIAQIFLIIWMFVAPWRPSAPGAIFNGLELIGLALTLSFLHTLTMDLKNINR